MWRAFLLGKRLRRRVAGLYMGGGGWAVYGRRGWLGVYMGGGGGRAVYGTWASWAVYGRWGWLGFIWGRVEGGWGLYGDGGGQGCSWDVGVVGLYMGGGVVGVYMGGGGSLGCIWEMEVLRVHIW